MNRGLNTRFVIPRNRSDLFAVLSEPWASDAAGIDANAWDTTITGGSTVARDITDADMTKVTVTAATSQTARLNTVFVFRATPGNISSSGMVRDFFIEWEMKMSSVANINNANSIIGLTAGKTDTRTTNGLIGFGLSDDAIQTVTDSGGTETTGSPSGITLTNRNLFKIHVSDTSVEFSINGKAVATHITNIPSGNLYFNVYVDAGGGGSGVVDIGWVNAWYRGVEDFQN